LSLSSGGGGPSGLSLSSGGGGPLIVELKVRPLEL